jgi:heme exporter protein B
MSAGRPRGPSTLSAIATILGKDLRVELRTLQSIPAMLLFSTTIYVVFRFGLDRTELAGGLAAGVLLVTILFAALLAINRIFVPEREQGGFEAVRLAPVDGTALFFAKGAALLVYLLALELVAVPVFWLFFLDSGSGLLPMLPVLLLLDLALAVLGALIAPIATNSTARDLIGPLILLPLLLPPMIAASAAGERLLAAGGPDYDKYGTWLGILGLYDSVFLLIGWAVFDFLLED